MKNYRWTGRMAQGLVEYILITALMALASIAVMKVFRNDVKKAYKKVGEVLINSIQESASSSAGDND